MGYASRYNRVVADAVETTLNDLDECTSVDSTRCTYDLNGNLVTKQTPAATWQYTYDPVNRLTQAVTDSQKVEMTYDPELQLVNFGKRYYDPQLSRWLTTDPAGFVDGTNLYAFLRNRPFHYVDPDGRFAIPLTLLVWGYAGVSIALPTITQLITTTLVTAVIYFGPVDEEVVVVDEAGNAIDVPQGNWLAGSNNGKWVQEMKPGAGPKGEPTGRRKDGDGHPPPKHTDARANEPHAHVPGVTNPDDTDWLPIKK